MPLIIGAAVLATSAGVGIVVQQTASNQPAAAASDTYGIWANKVRPGVPSVQDQASVTLGVTFSSNTKGMIKGIQFFRGAGNHGAHRAKLWTSSGKLLASVPFPKDSSTGWQTVYFKKPVTIQKSKKYVAAYTAPNGRYSADQHTLSPDKPATTRALTAYSGVYSYAGGMPRSTWRDSNYYVDVVFTGSGAAEPSSSPSATPTTTTPTTTTSTPTPTTPPPTTSTPTTPPSTGAFPNSSNTGVPAGTSLSSYTGPMTIKTDGTVIDAKNINGDLRIQAKNVVVKNSSIKGDVRIDPEDTGYSFTVQDTDIDAGRALGQDAYDGTGIGARDFTALRVEVVGGKRSINCYHNCTVKDSYVHNQSKDSTGNMHSSAIRMGDGATIVHNTLLCNAPNVAPEAGCSGDLTGYGDFDPVQNNLIQGNFFLATTSGGTCAYGGSSGGKPYSGDAKNIRFIDNVFQRGTQKSDHGLYICGYYATVMDFNRNAPGNVFTGNKFDDGTPVSPA